MFDGRVRHLESKGSGMEIKVLGSGCAKCSNTKKLIADVARELGIEVTVVPVTDLMKIAEYDVMSTPGVVIDGVVVSSGRVPKRSDVKAWLEERSARGDDV